MNQWVFDERAVLLRALSEELVNPDPDPMEIAILAGTLSRKGHESPDADAFRQKAQVVLKERITPGSLGPAVDRLIEADDGSAPEVTDALFALDELCAAAQWAGVPELMTRVVDTISRMMLAFHEPWRKLADAASVVLETLPVADPATPMWRSIEASAFPRGEG